VGKSLVVNATEAKDGWTCHVRIEEQGHTLTEHIVEVTTADVKRLAQGSSVEDLVRRSFEFLLERESPQSILRRFTLSDIERYFPEYPGVIGG
jgi:hypothetical protein